MAIRFAREPRRSRRLPFVSSTLRHAVLVIALGAGACSPQTTTSTSRSNHMSTESPSIETRARTFVGELASGEWTHTKTPFDATMAGALPPDKVRELWQALEKQEGTFRAIEQTSRHDAGGLQIVHVLCTFERGKQTLRIVFDGSGSVAGLFVRPPDPPPWSAPEYAKTDSFDEREVAVGTSPALPGTLSMPRGAGPFPALVLVHGSGPGDRDESVGGAKPFKDLAWGLASRGVAVLRHEKRTRHSPEGVVTQKEEFLDSARDAIALLRKTPGIDPARIHLLGHSQGGYLAPRIAEANPGLAGIVILAGSTRPIVDSLIDQLEYFSTSSPNDDALRATLDAARAFKTQVEAKTLRPDEDLTFPVGGRMKGAYFLDDRGYDPAKTAQRLTSRVLVLHGGRDYQVTTKDLDGWRSALEGRPKASVKVYPSLNHLFVHGEGTPGPAEYAKPGHVDPQVIADIASFVLEPGA